MDQGHVRIPNKIIDALVSIRVPGQAMQLLIFIIRKTIGWNKKIDTISLSQIQEATGIPKHKIIEARKKLITMDIIIVTQKGNDKTLMYCINDNIDKWKSLPKKVKNEGKVLKGRVGINDFKKIIRQRDNNCCKCCGYDGNIANDNLHVHHIDFRQQNNDLCNLITLCGSCHGKAHNNNEEYKTYLMNIVTITQKGNQETVTQKRNRRYPKEESALPRKVHTTDTITTDTITTNNNIFDVFWNAYPNKKNKTQSRDAWKQVFIDRKSKYYFSPLDEKITAIILKALGDQEKEKSWKRAASAFCPEWCHPATWLRGHRWEDSIETTAPAKHIDPKEQAYQNALNGLGGDIE